MSRETIEWLNENTLIGFTDKRGNAWHYREGSANHFPGPVPVGEVHRRLFAWEPVAVGNPGGTGTDGEEYVNSGEVMYFHPRTKAHLGTHSTGYRVHGYSPWLVDNVMSILDSELQVGSAVLLKGGAVASVQVELEESVNHASGVTFRPFLTAATSLDGSLATTYKTGNSVVVCHAPGTFIIDGDWRGMVQDHPSFKEANLTYASGREVFVRGVPFPEHVSDDHRYWTRERRRSLTGKRKAELGVTTFKIGTDKTPTWVRAEDLKPVMHEIGTPVDMAEHPVDAELSDTETAWAIGYLWGNGNTGRARSVTFSVPDAKPGVLARIQAFVESHGGTGKPTQKQGCSQVTLTSKRLYDVMSEFKHEGWAQKTPPAWAESAPLAWQRALVQGYYEADGNTDTTHGCILVSVSLDGLLSLRRILMRLGIPSSVRQGSDPSLRSEIQGRAVNAQPIYSIRFHVNVGQLGYVTRFKGQFSHPYMEDGIMWSRVESVNEWSGDVCPITTDTHLYLTDFGLSHNCDNTLSAALNQESPQVKIRHSSKSLGKIHDVRDALELVVATGNDFSAALDALVAEEVPQPRFEKFLNAYAPVPDEKGRSRTMAVTKRDRLTDLWTSDSRVTPWRGTAWGVLQMVSTFDQHEGITRNAGQAERNALAFLKGHVDKSDASTLELLAAV